MDIEELGRYTDAIACLKQTLSEGQKASNVDIQLMLSNVKRSQAIVRDLVGAERDDFYSTALSGLLGSLSTHADILEQKIQQLNNKKLSDCASHPPATPFTPSTPSEPSKFEQHEDSREKGRESMIESTIVKVKKIKFTDVIGLSEAKRSLHDSIIMPLEFPHLFLGGRKPWRRILLYGPPGTGKSRLALAASAEVSATFYCVSSADLVSSYIGESERLIKELFHHARSQEGQSIIFIDEIDSLCRLRNSREDDSTRRIKTELLIQMEAADKYDKANIFLLCATNCPWELDKAFLRRFQKRIYTPLPDKACRIQMMKLHCRENKVVMKDSEWQRLGEKTLGYSGSDLSVLTNAALFQPIRDLQSASYWRKTADGKWSPVDRENKYLGVKANLSDIPPQMVRPRDVIVEDFLAALKVHSATVSVEELEKFAGFTNSYGQSG